MPALAAAMVAAAMVATTMVAGIMPASAVMIVVPFVPVELSVALMANILVLVLAKPLRKPAGFNPHPGPVVAARPVVIAIVVEVVAVTEVDNIIGSPH